MRKAPKSLVFLLLAGCVVAPPVPGGGGPLPPVAADACGASALQPLLGQPASVLQTIRFDGPVRIVEPGMAVTMDYSAERLNIWLNAARKIDRITCG